MLTFKPRCTPLLVDLIVFKAGSTALKELRRDLCGPEIESMDTLLLQRAAATAGVLCIALLRDPVERFLSAYAQISEDSYRPDDTWPLRVPANSVNNHRAKMLNAIVGWESESDVDGRLLRLLDALTARNGTIVGIDKHLKSQVQTLHAQLHVKGRGGTALCGGGLDAVGDVENATDFFRAIAARLGQASAYSPRTNATHQHSLLDAEYRRERMMVVSHLRPSTRRAVERSICELYIDDYCHLGMRPPAACPGLSQHCRQERLVRWRPRDGDVWTRWLIPREGSPLHRGDPRVGEKK